MAIRVFTGFESAETDGAPGTPGTFDGLYEHVPAAGLAISSAIKRSGNYSMRTQLGANWGLPLRTSLGGTGRAPTAYSVGRVYLYCAALPSSGTDQVIFSLVDSAASAITLNTDNTGVLYWEDGSGTQTQTIAAVLTVGSWIMLEWKLDMSTATYVLDARVDEVDQATFTMTGQPTSRTVFTAQFRCQDGADFYWDDVIIGDDLADAWFGHGYVLGYLPDSDGTHQGETSFKDAAGVAYTAGVNTIWQDIDEFAPYDLNGPWQSTPVPTNYLEFGFEDCVESTDPVAVRVEGILQVVTYTAGQNQKLKLLDGATLIQPATDFDSSSLAPASMWRAGNAVLTRPSTGTAWTIAAFNALKARWGFLSAPLFASDRRLSGLMLEAAFSGGATPPAAGTIHMLNLLGVGVA